MICSEKSGKIHKYPLLKIINKSNIISISLTVLRSVVFAKYGFQQISDIHSGKDIAHTDLDLGDNSQCLL